MNAEHTIRIRLRLFGLGTRPSRLRQETLSLPEGTKVGDLLAFLEREQPKSLPEDLLVIVNGRPMQYRQRELDPLADGDEVTLMVPVAGGSADSERPGQSRWRLVYAPKRKEGGPL